MKNKLANAIRVLSMDAVEKAQSGHPGMPMGMADIAEVLWNDFLKHNPKNPTWINRDRFVVSNGHGSMLLYSLLYLTGYGLTIEDLKAFRSLHSKTPGHPEYGETPGVETTTGPLGQGLANAVGMSLAESILAATFNREGHSIIDYYTYCFVGDGCLMEGISHEACSLAGTLGLGKLVVFWDDNGISIDGEVSAWWGDDTLKRFEAYGWHVQHVDGHQPSAIDEAIRKAQAVSDKPSIIACRTVIGSGSPLAGTAKSHGAPLGKEAVEKTRAALQWLDDPFVIPEPLLNAWDHREKGEQYEKEWDEQFQAYQKHYPELAKELMRRIQGDLPLDTPNELLALASHFETQSVAMATRKASEEVLRHLVSRLPELLGGSADLSGSTLTLVEASKPIVRGDYSGNYIHYGVREFAMSAIMNGLALSGGFIPYGGTFLVFLDYARNAVRLSALMKQRVIFVYTHDSIGLGEDGPTHQPIEQLSSLRSIPNMSVWRPCDASETAVAWLAALKRTTGPTSLVLSRQKLAHQPKSQEQLSAIVRGGYILYEPESTAVVVLIATGSEVSIAIEAAKRAQYPVRVVSMPSLDTFGQQDKHYQESVLPSGIPRVVVEAATPGDWYRWVGFSGAVVGLERYGASGPGDVLFESMGITVEKVISVMDEVIKGVKNGTNSH